MRISIKTIIGAISGFLVFILYVSNVRPVGWFDSVVGIILASVIFITVINFKGLK